MRKARKIYCILDTETNIKGQVYEIAANVGYYDKNFNFVILHSMNCIVKENLKTELFYDVNNLEFWARKNLNKRHQYYNDKIARGEILVKSVKGINTFFEKVLEQYPDITLLAYNIAFDLKVCASTGICLTNFKTQCIWYLSSIFFKRRGYFLFCVRNRFFSPKSIMKTDCETLLRYLGWQGSHTHKALSDVVDETFIFGYILRQKQALKCTPYDWKQYMLPTMLHRTLGIIA